MPDDLNQPLVRLQAITKRFGSFTANDSVDLELRKGHIHALLGENGAGKSTLVKILYGLLAPTSGTIFFAGKPVVMTDPRAARALGIGMVFQHFSLFENLTVAENIALVLPASLSRTALYAQIAAIGERYHLRLEPARMVWSLSAGERQRIEIARCLLQDPQVLVLDEPTSVLTPQEAEGLFRTLNQLKDEGRALLYISHKLEEVRYLCDHATILRLGRVVETCIPKDHSARELAQLMVGAQIAEVKPQVTQHVGETRMAVKGLTLPPEQTHGVTLKNIELHAHAGQVLGIAGIAGNGQSELFAALSGERLADTAQTILMDGKAVGNRDINARRELGAAFIPEARFGHAAVGELSLSENVVLSQHAHGLVKAGFLRRRAARAQAAKIVENYDVRKTGDDPLARTLSGGNLQKFIFGREISSKLRLFVIDQPTWGVDARAASTIRRAIVDCAAAGTAVVVISQDLDELFEISDQICVIHEGHLSAAVPASGTNRAEIGLQMTGGMNGV